MNLVNLYARLLQLDRPQYGARQMLVPIDPIEGSLYFGAQRAYLAINCTSLAMRILCRLRPEQLEVLKFAKATCQHALGYTPVWLDKQYSTLRGKIISAAKKGKPRKPFSEEHKAKLRQSLKTRANRIKELEETVARLQKQLLALNSKN